MPETPPSPEKRSRPAGKAPVEGAQGGDTDAEQARAEQAEQAEQRSLWRLAGLGTELTGVVIFFTAVGWWLDARFGWEPWGLLIFGMLGAAVGLYRFIKEAMK